MEWQDARLQLRWQSIGRLGQCLEPPEHGILRVDIVEKRFTPGTGTPLN